MRDHASHLDSSQTSLEKAELRLEDFMPYRLNVLAATVSEGLARVYSTQFGIDIPCWRIIATLGQFGATTAKDIGQHTHMHKTKVSRAIADLEKRQLIQRAPNPNDKREAFVSLSAAGRAMYEAIIPLAKAYEAQILSVLSEPERQLLERAFTTVTAESLRLLANTSQD